jgi:hypothetical protein
LFFAEKVTKEDSVCGDSQQFKDKKCFKILYRPELQTYDNAMKSCKQTINLLTIRSLQEQGFRNKFLFVKNKIVDAFWIGLKNKTYGFEWNDGTEFSFNNWADKSPTNKTDNNCVQIV